MACLDTEGLGPIPSNKL